MQGIQPKSKVDMCTVDAPPRAGKARNEPAPALSELRDFSRPPVGAEGIARIELFVLSISTRRGTITASQYCLRADYGRWLRCLRYWVSFFAIYLMIRRT